MSSPFDIRSQMNGIAEAPGKTWFFELAEAVIDAGRCVGCGVCVAACPSDSIGVAANGKPALVKMCTGCSLCWDFCPRGGLLYEAGWPDESDPESFAGPESDLAEDLPLGGTFLKGEAGKGLGVTLGTYGARVTRKLSQVQDGGVVSALLIAALDAGEIDAALLARPSETEKWKGVPFVATSAEEVAACGGSFYNPTMGLAQLDLKGYDLPERPRLAVVGTPCEVQGLRAMQQYPWDRGASRVESVVLTIALLCTKSFDYQGLMLRELRDQRGLDLAEVGKVDVVHGKLVVTDHGGNELVSEPIKRFHGAALKGCDECADFLGRGADISVGSVGSPNGWSSVLVRTEAGAKAFALAASSLEVEPLENPEALAKLDAYDRKVAVANLRRNFATDGPLFWSYEQHADAYRPDADRPDADRPEPYRSGPNAAQPLEPSGTGFAAAGRQG